MAARRGQAGFRLGFGAITAVGVTDLLGWHTTLAWFAAYAALQAVERLCFRALGRRPVEVGPDGGRSDGGHSDGGRSDGGRRAAGSARRAAALLLLGVDTLAFCALAGRVLVVPFHWSGICAALLLAAALLNALHGAIGSRDAVVAATAPALLNILLLPLQLLIYRTHVHPAMLAGIGCADALIACSGARLVHLWLSARRCQQEAEHRERTRSAENERHLLHLTEHDPLTALPNRDMLCARLACLAAEHGAGALMLLDLDGFKYVNDTLGHTAGDAVLKAVAGRLVEACRPQDFLARVGADEFAIVLPGVSESALAIEVGERLIAAIAAPLTIGAHPINIGACIGITLHPLHGDGSESLLACADLALSHEKAEGRHGARVFEHDMRAQAFARMARDKEIARGIERGEFELFYQPQVSLGTGAVIGAEALLRWRHPVGGLLTPDSFLPAVELGALAGPLGQWVLETAANDCAAWRRRGHPDFVVAVNLFSAQFRAGTLVTNVDRALTVAGLAPSGLEIEITENIMLRPEDDILQSLRVLRAAGIGVALDDYGTGYASLDQLKKMPITRLKIDRSFTRTACEVETDAAIIRAVALLAGAFGLRLTAEGVETQAQAELVRAAGCGDAQGYLFGRPVPAAQFERMHLTPRAALVS